MSSNMCACGCGAPIRKAQKNKRGRARFVQGHTLENGGRGDKNVSLDADRKQRSTFEKTLDFQLRYFPKSKQKQYAGPPSWLGQERNQ